MNRKIIHLTLLLLSTFLLTIPQVHAATLMFEDATVAGSANLGVNTIGGTKIANSSCNDQYLSYVQFCWKNTTNGAAPTFTAYIYQLNATGVPSTDATALETSNEAHTTTTNAWTWYTFTFDNVTLMDSTSYGYAIVINNTGSNAYTGFATSSLAADIVRSASTGLWSAGTNRYLIRVYTESAYGGPTPTPAPTAAGLSTTNEVITTFTGYLIPLIMFLLPALILGWLTRWQKWPILIGLAIGAGLTYLFLGTTYLWLVILVVIGIGASAYQSTRGGS